MKKFVTKFSILAGLCALLSPAFLAAQTAGIFLAPPPDAPILSTPINYASGVPKNTVLSWQPPTGATSFRLQIGRDEQFSWMTLDTSGLPYQFFNGITFKGGVWYWWHVNASDSSGTGPWSETFSFKPEGNDAVENGSPAAAGFRMISAFPNPCTGMTAVTVDMQRPGAVQLRLYDPLGREQFRQTSQQMTAGQSPLTLDLAQLPAGVYYLRASVNGVAQTDAIRLVKR